MRQKHLPMQLHVGKQTPPVDLIVLLENEMRDIRAVVTVPQLDEGLGPDQLRRSDDAHRRTEHLDARRGFEPLVCHGSHAMPEREDHIEKVLVLEDLAEPAFVLDCDGVSEVAEVVENAGLVSRLAHDIEIFGRAHHAGIGAERIRAGQKKR